MPRYIGELITAGTIIVLAALILWISIPLPAGGGLFPGFAAVCTILLALYWCLVAWLRREEADRAAPVAISSSYAELKPMIVLAVTIAYVVLMFPIGFFLGTTLYLIAVSVLLGVRSWRMIGLTAIIVMPLIYLFFVTFLGVKLPQGIAI